MHERTHATRGAPRNVYSKRVGGTRTHPESLEGLPGSVVDVDDTDAALAAQVRVVEPDSVVVRDRHGEVRDRGAVARVAEARDEAVD